MGLLMFSLSLSVASAGDDPYTDQQLAVDVEDYRPVHPSGVVITRQVNPKFPGKAHKEGYRHEECTAQLYVGADGKPDDVAVIGSCPEVFHRSVKKAAKKWRFEPVIAEDGAPVGVTFVLRFRFEAT